MNKILGKIVGKNKVPINILQYADDTIFFGEATMQNVKIITYISFLEINSEYTIFLKLKNKAKFHVPNNII